MSVMIGIDPHKALHAVCAIDRHETELAEVVGPCPVEWWESLCDSWWRQVMARMPSPGAV